MVGIRVRRLLRGKYPLPQPTQVLTLADNYRFDLFLTKPTSFREVGRLLDNWEKNGRAATVGVPHGALTGESKVAIEDE